MTSWSDVIRTAAVILFALATLPGLMNRHARRFNRK